MQKSGALRRSWTDSQGELAALSGYGSICFAQLSSRGLKHNMRASIPRRELHPHPDAAARKRQQQAAEKQQAQQAAVANSKQQRQVSLGRRGRTSEGQEGERQQQQKEKQDQAGFKTGDAGKAQQAGKAQE